MAAITATANQVDPIFVADARIRTRQLASDCDPGTSVYYTAAGKADKCDANDVGKEQFAGIVIQKGKAGQCVAILEDGECGGFNVDGLDDDAVIFQGDTPGVLDTAPSATKTVPVGRVVTIPGIGKAIHFCRNFITKF